MDPIESDDDDFEPVVWETKDKKFKVEESNPSDTDITTYDEYCDLYRLRHDIMHSFVASQRGVPMGEKRVEDMIPNIKESQYYMEVFKQTPDIMEVHDNKVNITEIAVSKSSLTGHRKLSKYGLLMMALKDLGYEAKLEVIVLILESNELSLIDFCKDHQLAWDQFKPVYMRILDVDRVIRSVEFKNPEWKDVRENYSSIVTPPGAISNDQLIKLFNESDRKPFNSVSDMLTEIEDNENEMLTSDDEKILEYLTTVLLDRKDLELVDPEPLSINDFWELHDKMVAGYLQERSGKHISVFPLPYLTCENVESFPRDTTNDESIIHEIKAKMSASNDLYLRAISSMDITVSKTEKMLFEKRKLIRKESECIGKPKMDHHLKTLISVQGPGRKKYIKGPNPSPIHLIAQREKSLYVTGSKLDTSDLDGIMMFFSQKDELASLSINQFNGPGLNYVKFCQSVFQEVNINFLRKETMKNHIIKPTIVQGVYIIIHSGSPFKTGATNSLVWFKILVDTTIAKLHPIYSNHWAFKSFEHHSNNLSTSHWLSSDPHRLDHYIRSYDKILMSYLCKLQQSYNHRTEAKTISELWNSDSSDSLGVIITIYLEDKRCTSKMLQDVRYIVMTTISQIRYWSDMLKKFEDPIRSPLQLHLLRRIISFVEQMMKKNIRSVFQDTRWGGGESDVLDHFTKFCGSEIALPRILTRCPGKNKILFPEMLCEMYFTMLFNKDQDDPTHSSFQILQKILEGEDKLEKMKASQYPLHTGKFKTDWEDLVHLSTSKKKSHQFSRRVIKIASKLQQQHSSNQHPNGHAISRSNNFRKVSQPLSNFATFKSSATFQNDQFNKNQAGFMQNKRRRCLEGCIELVKKGNKTSADVFNMTKESDTSFQVFKKNQIGGVREILILDISTRIRINILESYSRSICQQDRREMLTHGDKKSAVFINLQKNMRLDPETRTIIHHNFDKKRWGPSFMPMQFIYLFSPFKRRMGPYFNIFVWLLIKHTNKKCYYPDHLIKAWLNHPDKRHVLDPLLTEKKIKFLKDQKLFFENESNMGQGILHYTSSYFHLAVVSLREKLYNMACARLGIKPCRLEDLISSDDSYTAQSISDFSNMKKHMELFLRAQSLVERLMNIETSRSKSSSSILVGEFNSLFISNLSIYPTTFKFAISSVYPFCTDSFDQMTKESFNSCRSLLENGGTVELFQIAHELNKKYCEMIYHTYDGGHNDPSNILNQNREMIPYQFGVYPIASPINMIFFGPESHNIRLYNSKDEAALKLLRSAHTVLETDYLTIYADLESGLFTGLRSIIAMNKVDRRLRSMMNRCGTNMNSLKELILEDPLRVFRDPENLEEVMMMCQLKLFQSSAVDAMKVASGSLFFGRISASPFLPIFRIRGDKTNLTFRDALLNMSRWDTDISTIDNYYKAISHSYEEISRVTSDVFESSDRANTEARNYVKLSLSDFVTQVSNPINKVLQFVWDDKMLIEATSSLNRDWEVIKRTCPIMTDSLSETLGRISKDRSTAVGGLILLITRLLSYKQSVMSAYLYGTSQSNPSIAAEVIHKQNQFIGLTSTVPPRSLDNSSYHSRVERNMQVFNEWLLREHTNQIRLSIKDDIDMDVIEAYCSTSHCPINHKKKFFLMLLYLGKLGSLGQWTRVTDSVVSIWIRPQKFVEGRWCGEGELLTYYGGAKCQIMINNQGSVSVTLEASRDASDNCIIIIKSLLELHQDESIRIDDVYLRHILGPGTNSLRRGRLYSDVSIDMGFKIEMKDLPSHNPIPNKVIVGSKTIKLLDINGRKIVETMLGLFSIEQRIEIMNDFDINGMSFNKMVNMRVFSNSFSMASLTYEFCLSNLDDLKFPKHLIKNETINEFKGKNVKMEMRRMKRESDAEQKRDDNDSFSFDNFDFESTAFKTFEEQLFADDEEVTLEDLKENDWMDDSNIDPQTLNMPDFLSLSRKPIVIQPGQFNLWIKLIFMKPLLIAKLHVPNLLVNKMMILKAINDEELPELVISLMIVRQLIKDFGQNQTSPLLTGIVVSELDMFRKFRLKEGSSSSDDDQPGLTWEQYLFL
jgi:hypothetical protein